MAGLIGASGDIAEMLRAFAGAEGIALDVSSLVETIISVHPSIERKEASLDALFKGGFVKCETARSLAEKVGISRREMGKLLNHLDIKVRECDLGCF